MHESPDGARPERRMRTLYGLSAYAHFGVAAWPILAAGVAADFGLDDARVTFLGGVASLGAFGTFGITRLADRRGRRRALLWSAAALPLFAAATALAPDQASFALAQIGVTALVGALMAIVTVCIAEEIHDGGRASGQAWFALYGVLGAALPLLIVTALGDRTDAWRFAWAAGALPILALPWIRRNVVETRRFERAETTGAAERTRAWTLFEGRHRRRAVGLLVAGTLRPVAITATLTWQIYHMASTLDLPGGMLLAVLAGGGVMGTLGLPLGARLANRWGRRPTAATFGALSVLAGVAFYWVPPDAAPHPGFWLALLFGVSNGSLQIFGVADRCLDTELFPTAMRATYAGWTRIAVAVANSGSHFGVSALTGLLGGLVPAITALSLVTIALALAVFLAVCPETKGLSLEAAALEEEPDPPN